MLDKLHHQLADAITYLLLRVEPDLVAGAEGRERIHDIRGHLSTYMNRKGLDEIQGAQNNAREAAREFLLKSYDEFVQVNGHAPAKIWLTPELAKAAMNEEHSCWLEPPTPINMSFMGMEAVFDALEFKLE